MRTRLGSSVVKSDDSLDNMLVMVRQKEKQKKRLTELRRQKDLVSMQMNKGSYCYIVNQR